MSNIAKCHLVWKGKGQGNRSFPSKRINISPFTKDFRRGEQDNEDFRVRPNQRHTHAITLTRWPEGNEKRGFIWIGEKESVRNRRSRHSNIIRGGEGCYINTTREEREAGGRHRWERAWMWREPAALLIAMRNPMLCKYTLATCTRRSLIFGKVITRGSSSPTHPRLFSPSQVLLLNLKRLHDTWREKYG